MIFAAVVALWVAYFVPLALRRYDEASRTGSVDRFSSAMRVLWRRDRSDDHDESEDRSRAQTPPKSSAPRAPVTRESARIAAERRRRTLLTLLGATVVVGALVVFAVLPIWSLAVPTALVFAWLVACRIQVRGELGLGRVARADRGEEIDQEEVGREAVGRDAADDEETVVIAPVDGESPPRKHVMERTPLEEEDLLEIEVSAVPVASPTGAMLWDPVPVTLPTYVTKPRAARTIRTIEFGEPGAWTSGHVDGEDTEVPRPADPEVEHRPAVGD